MHDTQRPDNMSYYQQAIIATQTMCNGCNRRLTQPTPFDTRARFCKWCGRAMCGVCAPHPQLGHRIQSLSVPDRCGYECRLCLFHPDAKRKNKSVKLLLSHSSYFLLFLKIS